MRQVKYSTHIRIKRALKKELAVSDKVNEQLTEMLESALQVDLEVCRQCSNVHRADYLCGNCSGEKVKKKEKRIGFES